MAKRLRAADRAYDKAVAACRALPLAQKVEAIATARRVRDAAYRAA